ncbi:hypothetical protein HYDPIDRAFT_170203 [Hydnomerulius pinastri MD-312]|uniref:Uncharacterized protein n=1 Tax=Hydnomerulius pinastri MD-312 TaxID=994086 RepID=A0A0C9W2Y0_9AGAM|nr:hypothetical protein HYDPIDRAFT_170203 [Hydnomerulius pinastri MD-312]
MREHAVFSIPTTPSASIHLVHYGPQSYKYKGLIQIGLYIESRCNPDFTATTLHRYQSHFWKENDKVVINDTENQGQIGALLAVDFADESASVVVNSETCDICLRDLCRSYVVGDTVRVISNSYGKLESNGQYGIITIAGHSLESYQPNQPMWAPFSTTAAEKLPLGMVLQVLSGRQKGQIGQVHSIDKAGGTMQFIHQVQGFQPQLVEVPLSCADLKVPANTLHFSPDRGYNVSPGDEVIVVCGDQVNRTGTVGKANLDVKTLLIKLTWNSVVVFHQPIMFVAHLNTREDHNPKNKYRGKEVLIINGIHKEVPRKAVIPRQDLTTTLTDMTLTPGQINEVTNTFARSYILEVVGRPVTPPPAPITPLFLRPLIPITHQAALGLPPLIAAPACLIHGSLPLPSTPICGRIPSDSPHSTLCMILEGEAAGTVLPVFKVFKKDKTLDVGLDDNNLLEKDCLAWDAVIMVEHH